MDDVGRLGGDGETERASVRIEVAGLSLFTHHGVGEAERELGQRLLLDLTLDLGDCDAAATDRLEDTIDYGEVCRQVALVAQDRSFRTLERLCAAVADHLLDLYRADLVTVRAAKPEPPMSFQVDEVAVELTRERR